VNWHVFAGFGLLNADGALVGALIHVYVTSPLLSTNLGGVVAFAGIIGATGVADRMRFGGQASSIAGIDSGAFGGGLEIRAGFFTAMLGLHAPRSLPRLPPSPLPLMPCEWRPGPCSYQA
jgi:hypothetical protein